MIPFKEELNYQSWLETRQTLHRWTQIIGKIRLSKSPWVNHSWHSTLYLTAHGLTTSLIHDQELSFTIEFDFIHHVLRTTKSDGTTVTLPLLSESVASFYERCSASLRDADIPIQIAARPNELVDATLFREDEAHCTYDPEYANRFWRILLSADRVMKIFRARFLGKVSPVHFFWGGFDLAVTRFSGRRAPEHPGGIPHLPDLITREAYSHEVSSCGFWPGNEQYPAAAFYSYAYPMPPGFDSAAILPKEAIFHPTLREFILPYEAVRASAAPDKMILDFFQSTYEAAANLGKWDRQALEDDPYFKLLRSA